MLFGISAQVDDFECRPSRAAYTQYVYSPGGNKLAVVQNGALVKATIPLPGGETAVYNASGLNFLRHTDWLGSSRLATTWAHGVYAKEAYAPFGETYNEAGTPDRSFTGQDKDVTAGVYDYLFRKYDPAAGRWLSPDPSGWKAVSQSYPQSLNRYAYVQNNPLSLIDANGLDCSYGPQENMSDPISGEACWVPDASYAGPAPTPPQVDTSMDGEIAYFEGYMGYVDANRKAQGNNLTPADIAALTEQQRIALARKLSALTGGEISADKILLGLDAAGTNGGNSDFTMEPWLQNLLNRYSVLDPLFANGNQGCLMCRVQTGFLGLGPSPHLEHGTIHMDNFDGGNIPLGTLLHLVVDVFVGEVFYGNTPFARSTY